MSLSYHGELFQVLIFSFSKTVASNVTYRFAHYLRRFEDTFIFPEGTSYGLNFGYHLALHNRLGTYEDRTRAVGDAIKCLGEELIPGIRNEVFRMRYHCMDVQKHICPFCSMFLAYFNIYSCILSCLLLGLQNISH